MSGLKFECAGGYARFPEELGVDEVVYFPKYKRLHDSGKLTIQPNPGRSYYIVYVEYDGLSNAFSVDGGNLREQTESEITVLKVKRLAQLRKLRREAKKRAQELAVMPPREAWLGYWRRCCRDVGHQSLL